MQLPAPCCRFSPGVFWDQWLIAGTVMLSTFMKVLDTSIANVALPPNSRQLSAGVDESTSGPLLTSYLVSNAIVLPRIDFHGSSERPRIRFRQWAQSATPRLA